MSAPRALAFSKSTMAFRAELQMDLDLTNNFHARLESPIKANRRLALHTITLNAMLSAPGCVIKL